MRSIFAEAVVVAMAPAIEAFDLGVIEEAEDRHSIWIVFANDWAGVEVRLAWSELRVFVRLSKLSGGQGGLPQRARPH